MSTTTIAQTITTDFLDEVINILLIETPQTLMGQIWWAIKTGWGMFWLYILIFLSVWVVWELITRNGGIHYNSANGFSPTFNRFVGSGVFVLFQTIIYGVLTSLFGGEVYLYTWARAVHVLGFLATGVFLNLVGFWKYLKLPRF